MDEDKLDTLCIDWNHGIESIDSLPDEVVCYKTRGHYKSRFRTVPRLPLAAMIRRMKLLEDNPDTVTRARGRAKLLSDRNRMYKKPGHTQQSRKSVVKPDSSRYESVSLPHKSEKKEMYNNKWEQEEFPALGFEHTSDGSPKKKLKSEDAMRLQETRTDKLIQEQPVSHEIDITPVENHVENDIVIMPRNNLKAKTKVKQKDFDFKKATQSLLKDFPTPCKPTSQVLSLTQHNLEKFLRESDNESSCSGQDHVVQEHVKEFEDDDMPLYEKYAVTLDDISRFKYYHVPFNLKGQLATLLNSTDTYHASPNEYFEKTDAQHLAPEVAAANDNGDNSTNSVVSELSNLNSPSDNEEEMVDNTQADTNIEQTEVKYNKPPRLPNVAVVSETLPNNDVVDTEVIGNDVDIDVEMVKTDLDNNAVTVETDSEQIKVTSSELKPSPVSVISGETEWSLQGDNVIQIDGVPGECDQQILYDYVKEFGTIIEYQELHKDDAISLRFRLDSHDACDYAVQCLHDVDCLFPETQCILSCHHVVGG
ncbi:hypothetical protein ACF0H5_001588 [Mactra antiquata]